MSRHNREDKRINNSIATLEAELEEMKRDHKKKEAPLKLRIADLQHQLSHGGS